MKEQMKPLAPHASRKAKGKLTASQREQIRQRRASGERVIDLAAQYKVTKGTIIRITASPEPVVPDTEPFAWVARQEMYRGGAA